jgi:hypothetical protein
MQSRRTAPQPPTRPPSTADPKEPSGKEPLELDQDDQDDTGRKNPAADNRPGGQLISLEHCRRNENRGQDSANRYIPPPSEEHHSVTPRLAAPRVRQISHCNSHNVYSCPSSHVCGRTSSGRCPIPPLLLAVDCGRFQRVVKRPGRNSRRFSGRGSRPALARAGRVPRTSKRERGLHRLTATQRKPAGESVAFVIEDDQQASGGERVLRDAA